MKSNFIHIALAVLLVILLVLLSDPFMVWMPPMAVMATLLLVAVIVSVWAGFIMKEQAGDEREVFHRMEAGRVAYLSGIGILLLALVIQGISGHIDPWIAISLSVMVLSKLFARLYFESHK